MEATDVFDQVQALAARIVELSAGDLDDDFGAGRIELITVGEQLISAAQALQAEQTNELYAMRRTALSTLAAGQCVAGEIAMARNVSPSAGMSQLALARGLEDMPAVKDALVRGVISERTARAVTSETTSLGADERIVVDAELAPVLDGLTPRKAAAATRALVVSTDAEAAHERECTAREQQYVVVVPEAHGTATLIAHGPAEMIIGAAGCLGSISDAMKAEGDPRDRGQIQLQTLVERVTGQARADVFDVEANIVIGLDTVVGASDEAAELDGYGPISPQLAEELLTGAHRRFYRRLLTDPYSGDLVARDPRRRRYDGPLAATIHTRFRRRCQQPGCDCKARDIDHAKPYSRGGTTTETNANPACKLSHIVKSLPGWSVTPQIDGSRTWTTPTGHTYTSPPPQILHRRRE